jgi:hypothetical protein
MVKFKPYFEYMTNTYLSHKFIASFMLDGDQKKKLFGTHDWKGNAQGKANFNKNMRQKLKLWLKEIPDMIQILKGLPPRVIENADLQDDLPVVANFMDTLLERIDPLPVAEHESGEMRVFQNALQKMDRHPNLEGWENSGYIEIVSGKKYMIRTASWTATPGEIRRCDILKKHIEKVQKHVDPSVVIRDYSQQSFDDVRGKMKERAEMMGKCQGMFQCIKPTEGIPTNPPCQPRIAVEENVTEDTE